MSIIPADATILMTEDFFDIKNLETQEIEKNDGKGMYDFRIPDI